MTKQNKTALVTGANSGLGFEAAAQLAKAGWGKVILACRSIEKGEAARAALVERTGLDPYGTVAIDTSEVAAAQAAVDELASRGEKIDFLLLNAGASGKDARFNSQDVEVTYASTLVGHHVLTMGALERGLLTADARIVIAGSEGARGNLPGMSVHDIPKIADARFDGNRAATIAALFGLELPEQKSFNNMNEYVTAKLIVAWWVAELGRRLPEGMAVNAVSPGANLETSFGRDASAPMRMIMMPMMKLLGGVMGMNGPIANGAKRYLDAADFGDEDTGHFYATAHKKRLVGAMDVQRWPEFLLDEESQRASFEAMTNVTGVGYPEHTVTSPRANA